MNYEPLYNELSNPHLTLGVIGVLSVTLLYTWHLQRKNRKLLNEQNNMRKQCETEAQIHFLKSRNTSMGELVADIAHQWKQPLNAIAAIQSNLEASIRFRGKISQEKLLDAIGSSFKLIHHLGETIDTFYGFLAQRRSTHQEFTIFEVFETIRKLTEYAFNNSHIELRCSSPSDPVIQGDLNEFVHALLNIVLNAKEALENNSVQTPVIDIFVDTTDDKSCIISICDNAGGIKIDPISSIFDRYTTSKPAGSGLGLFMTHEIIVSRFKGTINVENNLSGACFTLTLPYASYAEDAASFNELETQEHIHRLTNRILKLETTKNDLAKWADIFKHAHWGIAIHLGVSDTFELTNTAFNNLYGYASNELHQLKTSDLFDTTSLPVYAEIQKKIFRDTYGVFEAVHKRKDGTTFPVSIEIIVIKNDKGEILYHISNIWDETEKYKADELLRLKRFALNHIKEDIYLIDKSGHFRYVNAAACKQLGYTREELLKMRISDITSDWPEDLWPFHWEQLKRKKSLVSELYHRHRNGRRFPVEISANYFEYNGEGYNLAIVRDITERLIAEQQKSDDRMRLFFERQLVGMAIVSPEKKWLKVNKKFEEMLGYSFKELQTIPLSTITHTDDLAGDDLLFKQLLSGEIEHYFYEKRYIHKDGHLVFTNLSVGCVRNKNSDIDYLIVLIEDITERKQMEKALESAYRFLDELIDTVHDPIFVKDRQHRWSLLNQAFCTMIGKPRESLLGKSDYDFFPKEEADIFWANDEKVFTSGSVNINEETFTSSDGTTYIIQTVKSLFTADDGAVYLVGTIRDITMQKKVELSLRQSEEQFRALADNIPAPVFQYDRSGNCIYINNAVAKFVQKTNRDTINQEVLDEAYTKEILRKVIQTGKDVALESCATGSNGKTYYFNNQYVPVINAEGTVNSVLMIAHDITAQKNAEALFEAARDSEKKFRTLIDNAPINIARYDTKGRIIYFNSHLENVLALSSNDILGKTKEELCPEQNSTEYTHHLQNVLYSGKSAFFDYLFIDKNGNKRIHAIKIMAERNTSGEIVGALAIGNDITERKQEEKFSNIFRLSPAAISITSLERNIYLEVNESFLLHTQYAKEEVLGRSSADLRLFANPNDHETFFKEVLQKGSIKNFEYPFRAKDGSIGYAAAFASTITLNGEKCLLSHSYNITLRKELEALQEERLKLEERLSKIAAYTPGATYSFERSLDSIITFTYVTPGIKELFGISVQEFINDTYAFAAYCHPDDYKEMLKSLTLSTTKLSSWRQEFRIVHPVKGERWIEGHSTPEQHADGRIIWYGFFHDITERKKAEQTLHESEEKFRVIVENSPDVISRYDLEGHRTYVNPRMQELLGKPMEEIIGTKPSDFSPLPANVEFEKYFQYVITEKRETRLESVYLRPDGKEGWGEQRIIPEFDSEGNVVGVMVIGRDMSEVYQK